MTKPFSPIVKQYFRDRRKAVMDNALIEKQKFVNFNCVKGMERAYLEGYRQATTPTGRPAPTYHAFEVPKK
jgi:hypothetical protein